MATKKRKTARKPRKGMARSAPKKVGLRRVKLPPWTGGAIVAGTGPLTAAEKRQIDARVLTAYSSLLEEGEDPSEEVVLMTRRRGRMDAVIGVNHHSAVDWAVEACQAEGSLDDTEGLFAIHLTNWIRERKLAN